MTQEPVEKYFGTPISEWIARVANELEVDAVGLWQVIPEGIDSFDLSDEQLEDFGYLCVVALLKRGAVPVKSSSELSGWVPEMKYHGSHEEMAMRIISDWKAGKLVADHDGLWFALPP